MQVGRIHLCVSGVFLAASMGTIDNHEVVFRLTVFIAEILVVSDLCADLWLLTSAERHGVRFFRTKGPSYLSSETFIVFL